MSDSLIRPVAAHRAQSECVQPSVLGDGSDPAKLENLLGLVAGDETLRAETAWADVLVRFEFGDFGVELPFSPVGTQPAGEVVARIEPELAGEFWCGEAHEAALILAGQLGVTGNVSDVSKALGTLWVISEQCGRLAHVESVGEPRFRVLQGFSRESLTIGLPPRPSVVSGALEDQLWLAWSIVTALPPRCRHAELLAMRRSYGDGFLGRDRLLLGVEALVELARAVEPRTSEVDWSALTIPPRPSGSGLDQSFMLALRAVLGVVASRRRQAVRVRALEAHLDELNRGDLWRSRCVS